MSVSAVAGATAFTRTPRCATSLATAFVSPMMPAFAVEYGAMLGNPNMAPYSTAKAGIIGLTKAVAKEVAQRGVRVNAVAPATAETDILKTLSPEAIDYMKSRIPMGRFCRVEEIAEVIAFLASDKASFVTGQTYDVSGGRCTY